MTSRARGAPIWLALVVATVAACSPGDSDVTGSEPDSSSDTEPAAVDLAPDTEPAAADLAPDTGVAREVGVDDLLPVAAPIDVRVQIDNSDVVLSWSPPSGPDDFTYLIGREGRELGETAETTYRDAGLQRGVHHYQVMTVAPDSRWSPPVEVEAEVGGPDRFPPSAPWGVEIEITDGRIVVTWEESVDDQGVAGYVIHRNRDFHAWVTDDLRFVDSDVEAGQTYRYRIQARDAADRVSAPAGGIAAPGPTDSTAPSAPTIADVIVADGKVTIAWQDSVDDGEIWGYMVHRDGVFRDWVTDGTEFVDPMDPEAGHRYVIRAQDAAGNNSLPSELIEIAAG